MVTVPQLFETRYDRAGLIACVVVQVLVQIVIMYLVLGSVSIAVVVVVSVIATGAFTPDARLQDWVTQQS